MDIRKALQLAIDGKAVLFTGAGFSHGASNSSGTPLPTGKTLSETLLEKSGFLKTEVALNRAAAAYLTRKSKDDLIALLRETFSIDSVTTSHREISSLPWRRIYTTNYDAVFEKARALVSIECHSIDATEPTISVSNKKNVIVHINGSIERLNNDELDNSFKLTTGSYAADNFENSGWAFHFRTDIRLASAVIFVGYSLYDLDIQRVLFAEGVADKCVFITAPSSPENELEALELQQFGDVHRIGVDAFAEILRAEHANYTAPKNELLLAAWSKISLPKPTRLPTDSEIISYFTDGSLTESIRALLPSPTINDYLIERDVVAAIDSELSISGAVIVIHGELGTGKSSITKMIAERQSGRGSSVYITHQLSDDEIDELQQILEVIDTHKTIIIEGYHRHMSVLRWLSDANRNDVSVLLTERTDTHEAFYDDLFPAIGNSLKEFDVTKLTHNEIQRSASLLDKYGLWGNKLSWGSERKISFIRHDCSSEMPSLLLEVFKSRHVLQRYESVIAGAINRKDVEAILICLFALEVMNFTPSTYHIQELLGLRAINWTQVKSNPGLSSIIDFSSRGVSARSSVLGLHLLHNIFDAKRISQVLLLMTKQADERSRDQEFYRILLSLLRFSNLQNILPESQKLPATINFYEGAKNLSTTKRNPQFWLQYGIACLTLGQLPRAETYFQDAYSLAKARTNYDVVQIDNHYSRLLLEKALGNNNMVDALALADDAKKIVFEQMRRGQKHYPFRVALLFFRVFERWKSNLSASHIEYFNKIFAEIRHRAESVDKRIRNNRYVQDCIREANLHVK